MSVKIFFFYLTYTVIRFHNNLVKLFFFLIKNTKKHLHFEGYN